MDPLITYSIPAKGLYNGIHRFEFQIDRSFFENFENAPVTEGDVMVELEFDKHPDMYVLQFDLAGTVRTECDRCLAEIDLPIASSQRLLVKISSEEEEDEADIVYISPEASQFNVAQYVYEFICLAMPIIKTYDCASESPLPCNEEMLRYLSNGGADSVPEEPEEEQEESNPIWDELKKLSNDN